MKKNSLSKTLKSFVYTNNALITSGWNPAGGVLAYINNGFKVTGNGSSSAVYASLDTSIACVTGKKIYYKALVSIDNVLCSQINIQYVGTTGGSGTEVSIQLTPVKDNIYTLAAVITLTAPFTGNLRLFALSSYASTANANGTNINVTEIEAIDLTTLFGAGNEPLVGDCLNIFKFVDGTKQPNFSNVLAT